MLKNIQPGRGGRVSAQGRTVLEALATGNGPLPVAAVLASIRRPDVAAPVARASLSRTLRRLWADGLVELLTGHATWPALSEQAAYWQKVYTAAQAAPEADWQAYRRQFPTHADDFASAADYLEALRAHVACPGARVRRVSLTSKGRATVNTFSPSARQCGP
jgi:hypothetical protein